MSLSVKRKQSGTHNLEDLYRDTGVKVKKIEELKCKSIHKMYVNDKNFNNFVHTLNFICEQYGSKENKVPTDFIESRKSNQRRSYASVWKCFIGMWMFFGFLLLFGLNEAYKIFPKTISLVVVIIVIIGTIISFALWMNGDINSKKAARNIEIYSMNSKILSV
jgi:hypothetical protein